MKKIIFVILSAVICFGICSLPTLAADDRYKTDNPDAPAVYMTTEITPEALVEIYDKLGFNAEGNVAVKMSTGEPPASNYLRPELIGDLVKKVNGTIVECNTAYGGSRSSTAMHKQVAKDHGFTAIANVDIMDEDGSLTIPVPAPAEPDMHDIGILASTDPVAVDQACIDLIYAQKDGDGKSLVERIESRNGLHTLEHAAEIGLGSREYNLVSIDS